VVLGNVREGRVGSTENQLLEEEWNKEGNSGPVGGRPGVELRFEGGRHMEEGDNLKTIFVPLQGK